MSQQNTLCSNCREPLEEGVQFCTNCGQKVDAEAPLETTDLSPLETTDSSSPETETQAPPEEEQKAAAIKAPAKGRRGLAVLLLIAVIGLAMAAAIFFGSVDFNKQFSDIKDKNWCTIAQDGSFMFIDTNPGDEENILLYMEDFQEAAEAIPSINSRLGFSEALFEKMQQTRAMDGRLEDENKRYKVSWTYHPDVGLEILYEKK